MKKKIVMAAMALLASTFAVEKARAAEATAALDVNSAYVWRGITFNDGLVLQPSLDVASGGFSFNVWGNFDVDDYDGTLDEGEFSEVDLTASYTTTLGPVEVGAGVIEYLFPAGGDSTTELFITAGMDLAYGLSTSLEVYYDIDEVDDYYAVLGLAYSRELAENLGFELGTSISYAGDEFAEFYAGGTDSGFFNYTISAGLNYAFTEALGVGVNINYSDSVDDDALPDETVDTNFYGGVSIAYSF